MVARRQLVHHKGELNSYFTPQLGLLVPIMVGITSRESLRSYDFFCLRFRSFYLFFKVF